MKKLKYILLIILFLELGYFFYTQTNDIVVDTQVISDPVLKGILGDARIVQISDLHIDRVGPREHKLIALIKQIDPDILFITGDFISYNEGIASCREVVSALAQGRTVIATLGNGDHTQKHTDIDTQLLFNELQKTGITLLVNESLKLTLKGDASRKDVPQASLYIIGLNDNHLWLDDIFKATANVPAEAPKLLLAHAPSIIEKINTGGINLILSGHTHGGQIVFPYIGALYTNRGINARKKFVSGLYNEDTKLYVSRGIGTSGLPLRLFCKPEITVFKFN
jgi:uncharacterized protein